MVGLRFTKVTIFCRSEVFVEDCGHLLTEFQGWNLSSKIKVRSNNFNTYRFFHNRVLQNWSDTDESTETRTNNKSV